MRDQRIGGDINSSACNAIVALSSNATMGSKEALFCVLSGRGTGLLAFRGGHDGYRGFVRKVKMER
jgi:hypothetical protein